MSNAASNFGDTVKAMRPMVPAKDYETSKRFYLDLGFRPRQLGERLFEMQLGTFSFILQDYYVQDSKGTDQSLQAQALRARIDHRKAQSIRLRARPSCAVLTLRRRKAWLLLGP